MASHTTRADSSRKTKRKRVVLAFGLGGIASGWGSETILEWLTVVSLTGPPHAIGRVTAVTEDPGSSPHLNYQTAYTYDPLNNLLSVTQGSQPARWYYYDMLSRPFATGNPESGSTYYCYTSSSSACSLTDAATTLCSGDPSAVCRRTDARGVTTTYTYNDKLNRLTTKSYSDGTTPTANFFYDQAPSTMPLWTGVSFTNPKGRLVLTCTNTLSGTCTGPATATAYSYDQVGRTNNFWQCNPSNCGASTIWNTPYAYDWAGDVNSWVNPDTTYSATLTNTVNAAQQITAVQSSKIDGYHPQNLALITYTAWGAVSTLENGCAGSGCSNTQETYTYNKRLQPTLVELGLSGGNLYSDYQERFDRLDGILHAIGFAPDSCLGGDMFRAEWDDVATALQVSTYSLKALVQAFRPLLVAAQGASVVGLDFDARLAWPAYDWMGVAKAALESLTRYLARDLGPEKIRVNLVAAGPIRTIAAKSIAGFSKFEDTWATRAPLGWNVSDGVPVAQACVALMSDWFPMTTGEILHVDGGAHALGA